MILDGFWEDFGKPKSSKTRDLVCFGGYDVRDLNLVEFGLIFNKIAGEKHTIFWFSLVSFLMFFLTFETCKIVLLSKRELNFYKIAFFAFDGKRCRK